jgi:hypothetical protein
MAFCSPKAYGSVGGDVGGHWFPFFFLPALSDIPCRCAGMIACWHTGIQAGMVLPFPQRN